MRVCSPVRFIHALIPALALAAAGCNGSSLREPDDYQGCATDENWRTIDDNLLTGRVTLDDTKAPAPTNLAAGQTVPGSTPYSLAWSLSPSNAGKPGGTASCAACPGCGALTIEHEAPISGDVYDLQFSTDGVLRWRALTTMQSYTVPDKGWALLKGKSVSLRLTRVLVKQNDLQEGPYQATKPIAFSVGN